MGLVDACLLDVEMVFSTLLWRDAIPESQESLGAQQAVFVAMASPMA
tara:strand:- start:192 stop:332 length:141 start_codon:yes stop_codon:yes gene_type:complete